MALSENTLNEVSFSDLVMDAHTNYKERYYLTQKPKLELLKQLLNNSDLSDTAQIESVMKAVHSIACGAHSNNGQMFEKAVLEVLQTLFGDSLAVLYQVHLSENDRKLIDFVLTGFDNYYEIPTRNYKNGIEQKKVVLKDKSKAMMLSLKTKVNNEQLEKDQVVVKGFAYYVMFGLEFGNCNYGTYNLIPSKEKFHQIIKAKEQFILLPPDKIPYGDKRINEHISDWDLLPLLIECFKSDVLNHTKIEVKVEESDRNDTETEAEVETEWESENESDCE